MLLHGEDDVSKLPDGPDGVHDVQDTVIKPRRERKQRKRLRASEVTDEQRAANVAAGLTPTGLKKRKQTVVRGPDTRTYRRDKRWLPRDKNGKRIHMTDPEYAEWFKKKREARRLAKKPTGRPLIDHVPNPVPRAFAPPPIERKAYCIARSIRHAVDTMRVDWDWSQIGVTKDGRPVYQSPLGLRVEPISDCEFLRGARAGVILYLGYGFTEARDFRELYENAERRGFIFLHENAKEIPDDSKSE